VVRVFAKSALRFGAWKGRPAITLVAGEHDATFLPECGMLCASLRHRGEEFVAWPRTLAQFLEGRMTAVPFVHPWGNRLERRSYRVAERDVDLEGVDLPTDPNGLPMHGNLRGAPFEVVRVKAGDRGARLVARLDYGARPDLMRAFPFLHVVTIDARLDDRGLRITTDIEPTGQRAVPISFCWHPFFQLTGVPRREWELRWPACDRVLVDQRVIPTGERVRQRVELAPLGHRTFDDHYALDADRQFVLRARNRSIDLRFGPTYPFAQLYVPERGNFAAIEPMTATIDALGQGTAPVVAPGDRFRAWFRILCDAS
jgi:galactose mutarotase-like enzyme